MRRVVVVVGSFLATVHLPCSNTQRPVLTSAAHLSWLLPARAKHPSVGVVGGGRFGLHPIVDGEALQYSSGVTPFAQARHCAVMALQHMRGFLSAAATHSNTSFVDV